MILAPESMREWDEVGDVKVSESDGAKEVYGSAKLEERTKIE